MHFKPSITIGNRSVGPGYPCLIIAEIGQAHDGSLGLAHSFIDAVSKTGADAIKFQTHIASCESTLEEPWRIKFSYQDERRYDYWKRMEFTEKQWLGLKNHADEEGLIFLSSPFSVEAVNLLKRIDISAWKLASGEISNIFLFNQIAETCRPLLLSTGMNFLSEIDALVEHVKIRKLPFAILQCTSIYPTPPEKLGLNLIPYFRERYGCPVGLSDHSGSIYSGLAAVALGIDILEVHVTLSREMFGPDVPASITTWELRQLVDGVRFIEKAIKNPVSKDNIAKELVEMRKLFTKSVVASKALEPGTVLGKEHLAFKKPGIGIAVGEVNKLLGRKLNRYLKRDEILLWEYVE